MCDNSWREEREVRTMSGTAVRDDREGFRIATQVWDDAFHIKINNLYGCAYTCR